MPNEKKPKTKYVEYLRHAEYYDMQSTFDELYARSQAGEIFDGLMDVILSRENILLAYRNIKSNTGSFTPGTDKLKISDIGKLTADEVTARVRRIVKGGKNGYTPRSVRRKEIPKPNGSTRPLGIPCIWDRLVQQCIKQVMEPICEARFSNNSYGFRPNRSVENAIAAIYRLMQRSGLYYVVEFDIKGFFDNVDHSKLIKQLWSLNIRDKELLYVIRRILKAPILMPDGHIEHPAKGTPQGGIISPLLANVVLNELDHWIESQWQCNPVTENYSYRENATGCPIQSHAYRAMRNTRLKQTAIYSVEIWKRFRKWGGIPTGLTQNVGDFLKSEEIEGILGNSDFVYLLNQNAKDQAILADKLGLSEKQLAHVTNSEPGCGLILFDNVVIPFVDKYPVDTKTFAVMNTKPEESVRQEVNE